MRVDGFRGKRLARLATARAREWIEHIRSPPSFPLLRSLSISVPSSIPSRSEQSRGTIRVIPPVLRAKLQHRQWWSKNRWSKSKLRLPKICKNWRNFKVDARGRWINWNEISSRDIVEARVAANGTRLRILIYFALKLHAYMHCFVHNCASICTLWFALQPDPSRRRWRMSAAANGSRRFADLKLNSLRRLDKQSRSSLAFLYTRFEIARCHVR